MKNSFERRTEECGQAGYLPRDIIQEAAGLD
jgi:hypothetical protein